MEAVSFSVDNSFQTASPSSLLLCMGFFFSGLPWYYICLWCFSTIVLMIVLVYLESMEWSIKADGVVFVN